MILWILGAWIVVHYVASHLYVHMCTPLSLYGFCMSPFLVTAPHCEALRWTIYTGGQTIRIAWFIIASTLIKKFGHCLYNKENGVPT
jgi:hypothetical protein